MDNFDEKYMEEALKEAKYAQQEGEVPIGAIVVAAGKIIARTHNLTERLSDPTAHAEMLAITTATSAIGGKYLRGCTLYVTVEPCPMCAAALYLSQMSRVVYGTSDPKRGFSTISDKLLHPKTEVVQGVMEEECKEIIQKFFRDKRE